MYDYVVLGGGIVGVSTALSLINKHPDYKILLIEKKTLLQNTKLATIAALSMRVFTINLEA